MLREDVDDQRGAVEHLAAEELLQVPELRRRELLVHDHGVGAGAAHDVAHLLRLALPDERRGSGVSRRCIGRSRSTSAPAVSARRRSSSSDDSACAASRPRESPTRTARSSRSAWSSGGSSVTRRRLPGRRRSAGRHASALRIRSRPSSSRSSGTVSEMRMKPSPASPVSAARRHDDAGLFEQQRRERSRVVALGHREPDVDRAPRRLELPAHLVERLRPRGRGGAVELAQVARGSPAARPARRSRRAGSR